MFPQFSIRSVVAARVLSCVLLSALLAGCRTMPRGLSVAGRVGPLPVGLTSAQAQAWVEELRPYAYMSELAYSGDRVQRDARRIAWQQLYACWLTSNHWGRVDWPSGLPYLDPNRRGLYFDVWTNLTTQPKQLVIAFRGTESADILDWLADLRWFAPLNRQRDQYTEARCRGTNILMQLPAGLGDAPLLLATGHSLGGGLAQHLFYASYGLPEGHRVRKAYTFNPSPATGAIQFGNCAEKTAARHAREADEARLCADCPRWKSTVTECGFGTVRAYERGEVLAFLRNPLKPFWPAKKFITELKFEIPWTRGPVGKHGMAGFAAALHCYPVAPCANGLPGFCVPDCRASASEPAVTSP